MVAIGMPNFELGDIIIFYDRFMRRDADESGCNQFAVIVDHERALYVNNRIRTLWLSHYNEIENAKHITTAIPELRKEVADYFLKYSAEPAYASAGLEALANLNIQPFQMGDLFPEQPVYANDQAYEDAWNMMIENLGPFDVIFTRDLNSRLSSLIAWCTHGPFSHTAIYDGAGYIGESVTSGRRYCPIDVYKGRQNWVAAYRHIDNKGQISIRAAQKSLKQPHQPGYNYLGAAWAGTKAFFGNHNGAETPNGMIYQGLYYCIGQA